MITHVALSSNALCCCRQQSLRYLVRVCVISSVSLAFVQACSILIVSALVHVSDLCQLPCRCNGFNSACSSRTFSHVWQFSKGAVVLQSIRTGARHISGRTSIALGYHHAPLQVKLGMVVASPGAYRSEQLLLQSMPIIARVSIHPFLTENRSMHQ